jgi:hypothetical protein
LVQNFPEREIKTSCPPIVNKKGLLPATIDEPSGANLTGRELNHSMRLTEQRYDILQMKCFKQSER